MRHSGIVAVCVTLCLVASQPARSDVPKADPPKKDEPRPKLPSKKELMAEKLSHSQAILAGIALEDFAKLEASADELVRVSRAAEFMNAHRGKEYEYQVVQFRRSAETIARKAKDKNIDGVVLAYNDMTLSCLKCHQATRDVK